MNIEGFLKRFAGILMNESGDQVFDTLKVLTGGTTSARLAKTLNFAVSQMEPEECYLEVGVFSGSTLCAAGYMTGKPCVGIDKYDAKEIASMGADPVFVRDRCLHNIKNLTQKTVLIEKDFRDVTPEEIPQKVGVSFIDGKHDFTDVHENLKWLEPKLADHALLIFDDINFMGVSQAIFAWLSENQANYDLVTYVRPYYGSDFYVPSLTDRFLNNGIAIVHYHRNPDTGRWIVPVL